MTTLKSKRANPNMPGDTTRELTAPATDSDGQTWPKGTTFLPMSFGFSNWHNCQYCIVGMGGTERRFLSKQEPTQ